MAKKYKLVTTYTDPATGEEITVPVRIYDPFTIAVATSFVFADHPNNAERMVRLGCAEYPERQLDPSDLVQLLDGLAEQAVASEMANYCEATVIEAALGISHKRLLAVLRHHPEIKTRKPWQRRLQVHARAFVTCYRPAGKASSGPSDEDIDNWLAEVEERKKQERRRRAGW